jgi:hypothetical protein
VAKARQSVQADRKASSPISGKFLDKRILPAASRYKRFKFNQIEKNVQTDAPAPVDIFIVNYNSTDHTLQSLKAIFSMGKNIPLNVFIEDNGSKDRTERIRSTHPQSILTLITEKFGFSKAVNQAILKGQAPHVLLLNPDTVIMKNFFDPIINYMIKNPRLPLPVPKY